MYIKSLYIEAFAGMKDREFSFSRSLNIIEGANESGKSTLCMFIKFMFYGLSGRTSDGEMSERQKYVPWDTGKAAGTLTVVTAKGEFRITRALTVFDDAKPAERLEVIDLYSGERVFKGKVPGECILGVDEQMFVNTVFVRQMGSVSIDGDGMAGAIENILLSGDESVSIKRAVDRLEKTRKALMPKKGSGGKIQLLMQEKARLASKLEEAKEGNAALIAYENEAAKLSDLIEKRTREKNKYDGLCRAYKKVEAGRRLAKARELEARIADIEGELSALEKYGNIPEKTGKINALSAKLSGIENRLRGLRRSLGDEPDVFDRMSDEEILSAETDIAQANKSKKSVGVFAVLFAVMLTLSAALVAGAFFLREAAGQAVFFALLGTGAFLFVAAVAFLICMTVNAVKLNRVLKEWGVRNTDGLEKEAERRFDRAEAYNRAYDEHSKRCHEISTCEKERDSVIALLRQCLSDFVPEDIPDTDTMTAEALAVAAELSKRKEELGASLAMARGELRGYSDVLSFDGGAAVAEAYREFMETEAGRISAAFTTKDAAMAISKKNFAESALPGLIAQKGEVDSNLARVKATTGDTAVLSAQLDNCMRELDRMQKSLAGIEAATSALLSAGESMRQSLMPRVIEEANVLMGGFTEGKYTTLTSDRDLSLEFIQDDRRRDISYLSAGTADAAYISFRCALATVLFASDTPPLVYDESFARIDESRLSGILSMLAGSKTQSLVFTCRTLEGRLADRLETAEITVL
ncbi:MAG: hypothetical protein E7647_08255 [Ruminococcaceae bacterium]|nr:hypothetical protein [Oscillospiraceae bacterium]